MKTIVPSSDYKTEFLPGGIKAAISASEAKSGDLLMVPVDKLVVPSGLNVRIHDDAYEDRVEEVKDSIVENGFYRHMPLPGYAAKEGDQTFIYVTGGFTRFEAAKRAIKEGAPIEVLPVVLKQGGTSMTDLTFALAMDNTGAPLKPYERGIVIKRLVGYGVDEDTIAKRMTVTGQYVKDLLYLHSLPNGIQQMVIKGQVSAGHAISMARQHGPGEAQKILAAAIDAGTAPAGAASTGNGAAATNGSATRVTPRQTRSATNKSGVVSKKAIFAAIDYAIALPGDGIEFLSRWRKGEKDAVAEVAATMTTRKAKAPKKGKAKKTAKKKKGASPPASQTPAADPSLDIDL